MNKTRILEEAKAVGSSLFHVLPGAVRGYVAREWLDLGQSNDLWLRWRVARGVTGRHEDWVYVEGNPNAGNGKPEDWKNVIVGVEREHMERLGGAWVVAYCAGRAVTIGMNELRPDISILQPADLEGVPNPDGRMLAVAMRAGTLLHAAIGIATPDGRQVRTLQTEVLSQLAEVPQGIYRV